MRRNVQGLDGVWRIWTFPLRRLTRLLLQIQHLFQGQAYAARNDFWSDTFIQQISRVFHGFLLDALLQASIKRISLFAFPIHKLLPPLRVPLGVIHKFFHFVGKGVGALVVRNHFQKRLLFFVQQFITVLGNKKVLVSSVAHFYFWIFDAKIFKSVFCKAFFKNVVNANEHDECGI